MTPSSSLYKVWHESYHGTVLWRTSCDSHQTPPPPPINMNSLQVELSKQGVAGHEVVSGSGSGVRLMQEGWRLLHSWKPETAGWTQYRNSHQYQPLLPRRWCSTGGSRTNRLSGNDVDYTVTKFNQDLQHHYRWCTYAPAAAAAAAAVAITYDVHYCIKPAWTSTIYERN